MRLNTRPGRRLAGGAGVIAALALGLAGVTSTALPSNAVQPGSATNDPTSINEPGAGNASEFPGYNGYVDPDKADAVASSAADDTTSKPADPTLGEPGGDHDPDVPGAGSQPEEPDSDEAQLTTPTDPSPSAVADVTEAIDARGTARVIVMTDARQRLEGDLGKSAVSAQRSAIASSLDDLAVDPDAAPARPRCRSSTSVPSAVYEVTDDGPRRVAGRPGRGVGGPGRRRPGTLATSTGVIDSDLLNTAGVLGNNFEGSTGGAYQVAIIDSGVDNQHNAFTGTDRRRRPASHRRRPARAAPTSLDRRRRGGDKCTHSTRLRPRHARRRHRRRQRSSPVGTRAWPGARGIVAIKVGPGQPGPSTRWTAFFSAIDQRAPARPQPQERTNPNIASVNLSIGTTRCSPPADPACNAVDPNTSVLSASCRRPASAVVVAAGNDGSEPAMSFPGCAAERVRHRRRPTTPTSRLGSPTPAPTCAGGHPASASTRPSRPGDNHGLKDGTSMAAPHVAGALALLRECVDGNGVPQTNAAAAGRPGRHRRQRHPQRRDPQADQRPGRGDPEREQQRLRQRGDAARQPGGRVQRLRLHRLLGHRAG